MFLLFEDTKLQDFRDDSKSASFSCPTCDDC